ncbi:coenzyme F390 synthetase [Lactovum odontotermitis]
MENFDALNTVGIKKETAMDFAIECERTRQFGWKLQGVTVGLSSGTSGHRGIFLVSDKERAIWAGTILAKTLPRKHLFGHKIAFFMRADSALYETIHSRLIDFRFYDLQASMAENIEKMQAYQPTIIVAPPSALLKIAEFHKGARSPLKVISIAEVLEKRDAEKICQRFGIDHVHQIYQCTEGFLAATCEKGVLHLNEEVVRIDKEWLDDERFIPIISDLKRRTQPIMNYRLNDILRIRTGGCSCGNPALALESIEGRQDDIFIFNGPEGKVEIFPDFIRRCILFSSDVNEYRVVQKNSDFIVIYADGLSVQTKSQIVREFDNLARQQHFFSPEIVFEPYQFTGHKKLRRIESYVSD